MDFSTALPTFVITLREGVEAALVVGIVLACLKKAQRSDLNPWVLAGVGSGLAGSVLVGLGFGWLLREVGSLGQYGAVLEPMLEGVFSVLAIAMLSWMLIWMTRQARFLKGQVEGAVGTLLHQNSRAGWGVFGLILFAVLREGFETVLFIVAKFQQGLVPALGALGGLVVAAGIAVLLFRWGVKLNIRLFFQTMGVLLLLVVSGLVITAFGRFDQAFQILAGMNRQSEALCFFYERFARHPSCILGPMVWDATRVLPEERFPGALFSALFGYTQRLYVAQAAGYVLFLGTAGLFYFRSLTGAAPSLRKKDNGTLRHTPQGPETAGGR
ncbi:FTR1 family iron permease [Anthocerotibacter panamensis]|uniref:FTR1 family iron permease n=1 Tax=Anthocerotibacter panamensis TaxID=2857077 RepID=UPI001C401BFB|nr:FTR1 family protein [Anthocerotibacter panamensis]